MGQSSNTGRRRLRVLLGASSGATCALAMAIVLIVYGAPYDPMWWWVMALILAAAFLAPALLAFPIEWVIRGYREDKGRQ